MLHVTNKAKTTFQSKNIFSLFRIAKFDDCLKDDVINLDILKLLCVKGQCPTPADL